MKRWRALLGVLGVGLAGVVAYEAQLGAGTDGRTQEVGRYRDGRGRWGRGGAVTAGPIGPVDGGVLALNGYAIPLALQCGGGAVVDQDGRTISIARASSAYCEKSDGTVVLMSSNQPRRQRTGLLVERAGSNDVTDPRDCTQSSWTKSNVTCAKTATGADLVANSASTVTATSTNGTVLTTVTVSSTARASSIYLKRRSGSGTVTVTRDNFGHGTDISASLSSTTWKRVRNRCESEQAAGTGSGTDLQFAQIDNCIQVTDMAATAANPTIGLKLGTSGDAVDIDFVQDEALQFTTTPMAGFSRATEQPTGDPSTLPVASGEVSVDLNFEFTPGSASAYGGSTAIIDTSNLYGLGSGGVGGINIVIDAATSTVLATLSDNLGHIDTITALAKFQPLAGNGNNLRLTWGSGNAYLWADGRIIASKTDGSFHMPNAHAYYALGTLGVYAFNQMGGSISRARWTAGAVTSFKGSNQIVDIFGDSITLSFWASDGNKTHQQLSTYLGGLAAEKYVKNLSVNGGDVDQCVTDWTARMASIRTEGTAAREVAFMQCGINSYQVGPADAGIVAAKINAMWRDGLDAGVKVIGATVTPDCILGGWSEAINPMLRAYAVDAGIAFAETYNVLVVQDGGTCSEPSLNHGDGLHPNDPGSILMMNEVIRTAHVAGYW